MKPVDYIAALDEPRRSEIAALDELIRKTAPDLEPVILPMGSSEVLGYGPFHYRYESGREGDTALIALSSRKQYISIYVTSVDESGKYLAELFEAKLGKVNVGKSCVRFKRSEDLDLDGLRELIKAAEAHGGMAAV